MFKDERGKILYVGKAKDLKKRVSSYFQNPSLDTKTNVLVKQIEGIDHIITTSEIEAFLLEANLIKKYKPHYNIRFSDDKSYPYIKIVDKPIPYITISRQKDEKNATYFGRYIETTSVKVVLKLLRRIFPYQTVKNHPRRICLYYHLNLCPCITVNLDEMSEYRKNIRRIKEFLSGKKDTVIKQLEKQRTAFVKSYEFEKAKIVQDKIERIQFITSPHYSPFGYEKDPDLYLKRINTELTELYSLLRKYFPTIQKLTRIECFDISNIQGLMATGSMVVITNGEVDKSQYRKFKIQSKQTPDDYSMMKEILRRRLKNTSWAMPQLIIVDGGKGQVSAVFELVRSHNLNIPLIGLAKREEIIIIPLTDKQTNKINFKQVKLYYSSPALNILRRIRDEAHRFAISYHKLLRRKYMFNQVQHN